MILKHRLPNFLLAAAVLAVLPDNLHAQSDLRSRMIERARESREVPESATQVASELMESENASGVVNAVTEKLEGQSTEDLIRAAQQRIQRSREGTPSTPTITDTTQPAASTENTSQPMIPDPVASNRAQPTTATPVATPTATPSQSNGQLLTQADPAPSAAPTPPPAMTTPANVPPPVPLQPRYEKEKGNQSDVMEIEADESVMDNEKRLITFTGHVVVTEPRFNLTSDRLEVYMNDDTNLDGTPAAGAASSNEDAPPFKRAIASGGMVEIEKIGADGKVQIAKARKADYDAVTGDIVLSGGPPTLQSGSGFVNPSSPDAVIILRADGNHQIKGGTGRNKISIPLNRGGAPSAGGGLPTGNLESLTNPGGN